MDITLNLMNNGVTYRLYNIAGEPILQINERRRRYINGSIGITSAEPPKPLMRAELQKPLIIKTLDFLQADMQLKDIPKESEIFKYFESAYNEAGILLSRFEDGNECIITLFENGNIAGIYKRDANTMTPLYLFYENGNCKMQYCMLFDDITQEHNIFVQQYYYENGRLEYQRMMETNEQAWYTPGGYDIDAVMTPYPTLDENQYKKYFK